MRFRYSATVDIWAGWPAFHRAESDDRCHPVPSIILHFGSMKNVLVAGLLLFLVTARNGFATEITVSTFADVIDGNTTSIGTLTSSPGADGKISLREAVIAVNNTATGAPHRIILPTGTYQLTIDGTGEDYPANPAVGDLDFTRSGTILDGAGASVTIIQQTKTHDRVIEVNPNLDVGFSFTANNLTIKGGRETTGIGGGGVVCGSQDNLVTFNNCIFTDNQASGGGTPSGGAISQVGGNLTVLDCTFDTCTSASSGGAIYFDGSDLGGTLGMLGISGSPFSNNTSTGANGGAVHMVAGSTYYLDRCAFSGNKAQGTSARGGAVCVESGTLFLTNSTLLNNQVTSASGAGGAVGSADGGSATVTLNYCRLLGNSAATAANGLSLCGGTGGSMTANDNWWGVNSGPPANHVVNATATLWLKYTHTASPATITSGMGGTTTLTASFLKDSGGNTMTTANLSAMVGTTITFGNAVKGSLSGAQTSIQSSGTATATFTSTASGNGSATAAVDNESVLVTIPIAPSVSSVNVPANGLYGIGQALNFTVNFSEAITVAGGTPYLPVTLDTGGTVQAAYISGSGTAALLFRYTVVAGNLDNTGIAIGSAITANGATLRNPVNLDADLTLNNVPSTSSVRVDGVAPTITVGSPSPTVTTTGPVDYTVTYADANFNASTLVAGNVTLNKTSTANGTVSVSGSGLSRTVRISSISGHGTLGISIAASTASDTAGNLAAAAGPSATVTVNLPPTITGTVAGQAVNDNATLSPFSGVTIAYADAPSQSLVTTVTLDTAAKGAFTAGSLTASGFSSAGAGSYTFNGTAAAATTAIRQLVFAPTANRVPRGSSETTTFSISVTDGVFTPVVNNTTTVVTTSVNHAPTAVADTLQRFATESVKVSIATLLANDTDPDSDTVTISGVSASSAHGGSIYLASPWVHYVPASGYSGVDSFTYTISDGHGGSATGTVTVNLKTDDSSALNQIGSIQILSPGYRVTFGGIPGRNYTIQYTTSLSHPVTWQNLGTAAAGVTGTIVYDDNPGAPSRYYRTVYP
jgi:hypothetical protein